MLGALVILGVLAVLVCWVFVWFLVFLVFRVCWVFLVLLSFLVLVCGIL